MAVLFPVFIDGNGYRGIKAEVYHVITVALTDLQQVKWLSSGMQKLFNIHENFRTAEYLDKVISAAARIAGNTGIIHTNCPIEHFIKGSITAAGNESYFFLWIVFYPFPDVFGCITDTFGFINRAVTFFR